MNDEEIRSSHELHSILENQNLKNIPPPIKDVFR
jgi:hypothetical protein